MHRIKLYAVVTGIWGFMIVYSKQNIFGYSFIAGKCVAGIQKILLDAGEFLRHCSKAAVMSALLTNINLWRYRLSHNSYLYTRFSLLSSNISEGAWT